MRRRAIIGFGVSRCFTATGGRASLWPVGSKGFFMQSRCLGFRGHLVLPFLVAAWVFLPNSARAVGGSFNQVGAGSVFGGVSSVSDVIVSDNGSTLYAAHDHVAPVFAATQAAKYDLAGGGPWNLLTTVSMPARINRIACTADGTRPVVQEWAGTSTFAFDPVYFNGAAWVHSTRPAETWGGGGPADMGHDALGLFAMGRNMFLRSSDSGATFHVASDLQNFYQVPGPRANAIDYVPGAPAYQTNMPFPSNYWGWTYVLKRTPWGEILAGGETQGIFHSLDDGATWEHIQQVFYQPQRDSAHGYAWFSNPSFIDGYSPANQQGIGWTKDGELIFTRPMASSPAPMYRLTSTGDYVPAAAGLPTSGLNIGRRMARTDAGELYVGVTYTSGSQVHNLFVSDGSAWTEIPNCFSTRLAVVGNGSSVLFGSGPGVRRYTPNAPGWPVVDAGSSVTITLPALATVSASASPLGPAFTYAWSARGPGQVTLSSPFAATTTCTFSCPGHYVLNCRATSGTVSGGDSVIVRVNPDTSQAAPTITAQPQNTILVPGSNATFFLAANGTALRYQWRRNGSDIADATSPTLVIQNPQATDNGDTYCCLVASPHGRVLSQCGVLGNPPTVVAPPATQTVAPGTQVSFAVAAGGTTPMWCQWYRDGVPIASGGQFPFYTLASPLAADEGAQFSVVVNNIFGSTTSSVALLHVGAGSTHQLTTNYPGYYQAGYYNPGTVVGIATNWFNHPLANKFQSWSATGGAALALANRPMASVTTPAAGAAVTVTPAYAAVPANRLSVVNGSGDGTFFAGNVVPISAYPAPAGLQFDRWVGSGIANAFSVSTTVIVSAASESRATATYKSTSVPVTCSAWCLQ